MASPPDPEALLARIQADLRVAHALSNADRPTGLTASSLGGCMSYAARTLLDQPQGDSEDYWRALRGTYIHEGLGRDVGAVDPGFIDGRTSERFTWDPGEGLPVITGLWDGAFSDIGLCVDWKSRSKAECRWHADHGADPNESMQIAAAATANGLPYGAAVYYPTDGGAEDIAVAMVDVPHWTREAVAWLRQVDVRDEYAAAIAAGVKPERAALRILDPVPRDPAVSWCKLFCGHFRACRGDYIPPADLEIQDPVAREAAGEAEYARQKRLEWTKTEEAAKAKLAAMRVHGTVHDGGPKPVKVTRTDVDATDKRRGHTKINVTRK